MHDDGASSDSLDDAGLLGHVKDVTAIARNTWIVLMTFCGVTWTITASISDSDLLANTRSLEIPFLQAEVPPESFFTFGSIVLTLLFLYFNIYVVRLWTLYGKLPFTQEDLPNKIAPWIGMALLPKRSAFGAMTFLSRSVAVIALFLAPLFTYLLLASSYALPSRNTLMLQAALLLLNLLGTCLTVWTIWKGNQLTICRAQTSLPLPHWVCYAVPPALVIVALNLSDVPQPNERQWTLTTALNASIDAPELNLIERPNDWKSFDDHVAELPFECQGTVGAFESSARSETVLEAHRTRDETEDQMFAQNSGVIGQAEFAKLNEMSLQIRDLVRRDASALYWRCFETVQKHRSSRRRSLEVVFGDAEPGRAWTALSLSRFSLNGLFAPTVNFDRTAFPETELRNAVLEGAFLNGANLASADLSFSQLQLLNAQNANFSGAILDFADLRHAGLFGSDFGGASVIETNFEGAGLGFSDDLGGPPNFSAAALVRTNFGFSPTGLNLDQSFVSGSDSAGFDEILIDNAGGVANLLAPNGGASLIEDVVVLSSSRSGTSMRFLDLEGRFGFPGNFGYQTSFGDASVKLSKEQREKLPCQWAQAPGQSDKYRSHRPLSDREFFGRWREWLERGGHTWPPSRAIGALPVEDVVLVSIDEESRGEIVRSPYTAGSFQVVDRRLVRARDVEATNVLPANCIWPG